MTDKIIAAQESAEVMDYLLHRRSVSIKQIGAPGPAPDQIQTILQAAARVPDHGKMFPWHFIVIADDARQKLGEAVCRAFLETNPDAAPAKLELEAERFTRSPVVIAVISRIREGKNPAWEQILSAGASCQNLSIAANALGFGTNWVTEWYSYNDTFRKELGLDDKDHIAGFIHIGTPQTPPEERPRPELDKIVTHWEPGITLNKGEGYGHEGLGYPGQGFSYERDHD